MATINKEEHTPEETAQRRDEVIKHMLNTPPQPHKEPRKEKAAKKPKKKA